MKAVDAHRHIWDKDVLRYPWLQKEPALRTRHLPEDAPSRIVDRAIFIQAGANDGLREARWVQGLAAQWPELIGIVALAPIEEPTELVHALDVFAELPLFVGVRRLFHDESSGFIESDKVKEGLAQLARRGLPFDACIRHGQLAELTRTVASVEGLAVVLDHLGKPPIAAGVGSAEGVAWAANLRRFAALPRTMAKISGLAPEAAGDRPLAEQIGPFIDVAIEAFGAHRIMVGSDWPVSGVTPHRLDFDEWFTMVRALTDLSAEESVALFQTAALEHYGISG